MLRQKDKKLIRIFQIVFFMLNFTSLFSQSNNLYIDSFLQYKLSVGRDENNIKCTISKESFKYSFSIQKDKFQYISKSGTILNINSTDNNDSILLSFDAISDSVFFNYKLGNDDSISNNQISCQFKNQSLFIWPINDYAINSYILFNPRGGKRRRLNERNISLNFFIPESPRSAIYSILIKQRCKFLSKKQVWYCDILFYGNNFMAPTKKVHLKLKS